MKICRRVDQATWPFAKRVYIPGIISYLLTVRRAIESDRERHTQRERDVVAQKRERDVVAQKRERERE